MDEEEEIISEEERQQQKEQAKQYLKDEARDRYKDWRQRRTSTHSGTAGSQPAGKSAIDAGSQAVKSAGIGAGGAGAGAAGAGAAGAGAGAAGAGAAGAGTGAAGAGAAGAGAGAGAGAAAGGMTAGGWVLLILVIIIVVFIVIVVILVQTGFIYTNRNDNPTIAYDSGVTITDSNGENAVTISLEDYVKGAVYAQAGDAEDNAEYIKALSVIFRGYAIINYESIANDEIGSLYNSNYAVNTSIAPNVNTTKGEYLKYDDIVYDIDVTSINKEQMKSLALEGKTYKEILSTIYGEEIQFDTASLISTDGLQQDENGFYMRLAKPLRTNAFYYEQDSNNYGRYYEGECAAYATSRAQEILASINSNKTWNANVNGGNYCNTTDAKKFTTSSNYEEPKVGSIVSWQKKGANSGQGHVAIVEKVADGKVTISESFNNLGSLGNSYIRSNGSSASRKKNCLNNGCFRTNILSLSEMSDYGGNYTFKCYIYLVEE